MPYITKNRRKHLDCVIDHFSIPQNTGELVYVLTKMCHKYVEAGLFNFVALNSVIGALECTKTEFYRKVVAPYEEKKRRENGSVSDLDARTLEDVR